MENLSVLDTVDATERTAANPNTLLGRLQLFFGWASAARRHLLTLTDEDIIRGAGVRFYARTLAPAYIGPDWLEKATAEGHAFLDAFGERVAALEAETLAELGAAWAEFHRVLVRRSDVQVRPDSEAHTEPEGAR